MSDFKIGEKAFHFHLNTGIFEGIVKSVSPINELNSDIVIEGSYIGKKKIQQISFPEICLFKFKAHAYNHGLKIIAREISYLSKRQLELVSQNQ